MAQITLKGLHQVRKVLKNGAVRWYAFAWRGKGAPTLWVGDHKLRAIPPGHPIIEAWKQAKAAPPPDALTVAGLIDRYEKSAKFASLRPSTQADYLDSLRLIRAKWGKLPLVAIEDRRFPGLLMDWRDQELAPKRARGGRVVGGLRLADKVMSMMASLCTYAIKRGELTKNPANGLDKLHEVDRSDLIWDEEALAALRARAPTQVMRAVDLARLTGLALSDLITLPWSAVGPDVIDTRRLKTHRPVEIPLYPALRACLADQPRRSPIVLTNSRGHPWTASGLSAVFRRARDKAQVRRHFHDFRGTAATALVQAGLREKEIALVLGWSEARVEAIARRYVSRSAVIASAIERLHRVGQNEE